MAKNEFICDCNAVHHDVVEKILDKMPEEEYFSRIAEFYKIMGDVTRCKIIFSLLHHEMCVCDIANALTMTKSSISHQLGKMRKAGVVKCRREGKEVYYSLDDEHVEMMFGMAMEHIEHVKNFESAGHIKHVGHNKHIEHNGHVEQ